MIENGMNGNQLMSNMNLQKLNQIPFYYPRRKILNNVNQINQQFIQYQYCQTNNYNNIQISYFNRNFFLKNNLNKFDTFNTQKYIRKQSNLKNYFFNKSNEFDKYNYEETSFEEKDIKKESNKKCSIDSNIEENSFNTNFTDEDNGKKEELGEKTELKKDDNLSKNIPLKNEKFNIHPNQKVGRRYSNTSKCSDYSKCSKTTLNSSVDSIKEKDVFFDNNNNNLEKKHEENKFDNKIMTEKYEGNPIFENTEILKVNVKLSKDRTATFKLKRYDDLFLTIKLFCEINSVDEKFLKPLIIKSLSALNTIYQIMNSQIDTQQINVLKKLKNI